ncbi:MAG: hypothetical protein WD490_04725 [Opitutales bacterium]
MKNLILAGCLFLLVVSTVAADVIIEIRNSDGNVEAAFLLGDVTRAEKEFDAVIEYEEIGVTPYPLPHAEDDAARKTKRGVGTSVTIDDFAESDGYYTFSLLIQECHFERFEVSHTPSRVVRTPMFQSYELSTTLTVPEGETPVGEIPNQESWSLLVKRLDAPDPDPGE